MSVDQKVNHTYSIKEMIRFLVIGLCAIVLSLIYIFIWVFFFFDETGQFNYDPTFWWILPGIIVIVIGTISVAKIMRRLMKPSPEELALRPSNYYQSSREEMRKLTKPLKIGMYLIIGVIGILLVILILLRWI